MLLTPRTQGGLDVELGHFQRAARDWARRTGKTQAEVLRTSAKMTISNPRQGSGLLQITPPCSKGRTGLDGKRAGEAAIARDLGRVFRGVRIMNRRAEQWPDVEGIHRRLFADKRPGSPLRSDRGRQGYYVDEKKLRLLGRQLRPRVGHLAAGWVPSARALGAAVPAWIGRHGGSRGTIRMSFSAPRYSIEMTCFAPPNSPWQELERRVPYAIRYATNNLERQMQGPFERDARASGFGVR